MAREYSRGAIVSSVHIVSIWKLDTALGGRRPSLQELLPSSASPPLRRRLISLLPRQSPQLSNPLLNLIQLALHALQIL